VANSLQAEGSKDFWDYPGTRLFYNAEQNQQLKVFARQGEFINIGASHVGITGGFINVFSPDGTLVMTFNGDDGKAIINNDTEELNGPTGGGTTNGIGYNPGVVPVTMNSEGVWTIQLGFPMPLITLIMGSLGQEQRINQPYSVLSLLGM